VRACASVQQSYGIARGICHPRSKPSSIPCDSDWVLGSHEWFSDLGRAEIPVPQDRQVLHPLHSADASRCGRIHRRRHRRLVLSGSAGLAFMSYARPPKTHDGITEKVAVIWRKPPLRPPGRMSRRLGPRKARVPRSFSGFETENRCVQRLGGAHRIKIFPQERDLAVHGPQEDHIILAIHTARRLN